jgi:tetratricopeptide (TPR) repeat protein
MCVPPQEKSSSDFAKEKARLDSLRDVRCPRLMSSAAEYYRNRDWKQTIRIYSEITDLDCDEWNVVYAPPEEIYQYYSFAYTQIGRFDSAEFVLLDGLQKIPQNIQLRKQLAYAYKRQGKTDNEIIEYERLVDIAPDDITILNDLAKIYKDQSNYDDQIIILKKMLKLNDKNDIIQSELAIAYENSGRNPLEVYEKRYMDNSDNISYGLDYSERLINADRIGEAKDILKRIISKEPTSKLAYQKLGKVCWDSDDLDNAASAYETLFKVDPRDGKVAIDISDIYIDSENFGKALRWADKAINLIDNSGKGYGQKGKVYYRGWEIFKQNPLSVDDRIVAKLAYTNFVKAEKLNYLGFNRSKYLKENAKDILYGKAQWFMAEDKVKRSGIIRTTTSNYDWVTDKLSPEKGWKK